MNYLNQSKEIVCKSLLSKVNLCDREIHEAEKLNSFDEMKQAYLRQQMLLKKLERIIS